MLKFLILFILVTQAHADIPKCEATYDSLNVVHQEVNDEKSFYYCFGFHHAKDRAWQMDYFRRAAQGRNAEILGFAHMKSDLMMKLLDLPSQAQKIWQGFSVEEKKILEAYADGANAGFKIGKEAQEFKDKSYAPEKWLPEHSIEILLLQAFDQTRRAFSTEYEEEKHKENWGADAERLFNEDHVPWLNTILKDSEYEKAPHEKTVQSKPRTESIKLWAPFPAIFGEESGSNNWVIHSKKSKNGFATLANDPHLDLRTPLFWYFMNLKSPELHAFGGSVPGAPIIATGTNGQVAWGLTNAYINTGDAYFVKDIPDSEIETIRPFIWIKWGFIKLPFFFKSFEKSKTGHPVLPLELAKNDRLFLKWVGFDLSAKDILPMFNILKVKDVEEADDVLKTIGLPSWNYVFADKKGNIGFRVVGKIFKETSKSAFGIREISKAELLSQNYLLPDEKPGVINPQREYVYTANNRHWPLDAKFYGGRGYSNSFRGFRIDELLKDGKHDVESFKAIQCDRQAVDARFFVPQILKYLNSEPLATWEFQTEDHSGPTSVYRRLMDIMMTEWKVNEYALFKLLEKLPETKIKEIKTFYDKAIEDIAGKNWGDLHRLSFDHLSKNLDWKFSPKIAGIGDNHSVDPGTSKWNDDRKIYEQNSGASMRMIIEMREVPKIFLVLPGLNRDYAVKSDKNPWMDWKNCQLSEISF